MENKEQLYFQDDSSHNENQTSIREVLENYAYYWKWFLLSLILALVAAFFYVRYAQKQYSVESKILLMTEANSLSAEMSALSDFSSLSEGANVNIEDQMEVLRSRRLMTKVAENLALNVEYHREGRVPGVSSEIFSEESPIKVTFIDKSQQFQDRPSTTISVKIKSSTEIEVSENSGDEVKTSFGKKIKTNSGDIIILPNKFQKTVIGKTFKVKIMPMMSAADIYRNNIVIEPVGKKMNVIRLGLVDNLRPKAIRIVDELVYQYNEDAVNDKKLIGEKTLSFIDDRLNLITQDLQGKDQNIQDFKSSNNVTDLTTETQINLQTAASNDGKLLDYSTQLNLVEYMDDYVKSNNKDLIPVNVGLSDASINQSTQKYNDLVLQRNELLKSMTPENPIVKNLDEQLRDLNNTLLVSLKNYKNTTQIAVNRIQGQGGKINNRISAFPAQEKVFRDISRQQQIVESIYLFLLQKKEETEISNASTPASMKIIDTAFGGRSPVSPKKNIIYLGAGILGLLIPFGVLYTRFLLDNKVHTRKQVEDVVKAPVIGDVPTSDKTFIEQNDRSVLAEAFRIIRTNVNFYLSGNKKETKNIYITSTISGEGKTFVATNLATILSSSTTKNRVLIIEADIRSPKVLDYLSIKNLMSSRKGITHFLMDHDLVIDDIIIKDSSFAFDIISAGVLAPNPSELLMNGRFQEMINQAQGKYDFVVVDTAPVSLVTDTQLIANQADLFIYVARANYLDKRLLNIPRELYRDKKLPNMAMLLNDVGAGRGYGYGYGYGTGYGYGYGYVQKKAKWYDKILPKNMFKKK